MKVQEAYRTPNKLDQKRKFHCHIIIKKTKHAEQRILKAAKEKDQITYKGRELHFTSLRKL